MQKGFTDSHCMNASNVSRADLLRCYGLFGESGLSEISDLAGFSRIESEKPPIILNFHDGITIEDKLQVGGAFSSAFSEGFDVAKSASLRYFRVTRCRWKEPDEVITEAPPYYTDANPLRDGEAKADRTKRPPQPPPLVPWSRLWPFLKAALGKIRDTGTPDMRKTVKLIASCKPIKRLPPKQRRSWAPSGRVLLDCDERLGLFWDDEARLLRGIRKMRGGSGLDALVLENGPFAYARKWGRWKEPRKKCGLPETGTPLLVVSDLGCFDPTGESKKTWKRFGKLIADSGLFAIALTPCPPRLWDKELGKYFKLVSWDRGRRLPLPENNRSSGFLPATSVHEAPINELLTLVSVAVRVEPGLLRSLRLLLADKHVDVGTEAEVWNHQHANTCHAGTSLDNEGIETYRPLFREAGNDIQDMVLALLKKYHDHLSPVILAEEKMTFEDLTGKKQDYEDLMLSLLKAIDSGAFSDQEGLKAYFLRMFERQHPAMWKEKTLAAAWVMIHKDEIEKGEVTDIPPGLDINLYQWLLPGANKKVEYVVKQVGNKLVIDRKDSTGLPVTVFTSARNILQVSVFDKKGERSFSLNIGSGNTNEIDVTECERIVLHTDSEEIELESTTIPEWAAGMGRDKHGLFAEIKKKDGDEYKAYYCRPDRDNKVDWAEIAKLPEQNWIYKHNGWSGQIFLTNRRSGFFWYEREYLDFYNFGIKKPSWAIDFGSDEYGIWADVQVKKITFRMRLILPGEFMMGSPEDEYERLNNEAQHKVILTKAFWIADTACTQELWKAVMGKNPSNFKGEQLPVEQASWEECMDFIGKINTSNPGLDLRLPTEAEWEYSCRAGTQTPFSFGDNITTDQVNYNGNFPYAGAKKGEYRGKTVPVKSLPCNQWGLYEMHGNVWEWCSDWYGEYSSEMEIDPEGPDTGSLRVLRGGSWFDFALGVRSAYRNGGGPAFRRGDFGFRLSRGHNSGEDQA